MAFENLSTMAQVNAVRRAEPKSAITARLAEKTKKGKDEKAKERVWRKGCIARDGKICQCCKRVVVAQLELAPFRLEVHHIEGRANQDTRWDVRNGIVLCFECHEKVTHKVLLIVQLAKFYFRLGQDTYVNAFKPLTFKVAA